MYTYKTLLCGEAIVLSDAVAGNSRDTSPYEQYISLDELRVERTQLLLLVFNAPRSHTIANATVLSFTANPDNGTLTTSPAAYTDVWP